MITVLLLNYKRKKNIESIIETLKNQTLDCEIFLWNNSNEVFIDNRVDWIVNSNDNKFYWPRWFMGVYASNEFIMSMDDDLTFTHSNALKDLHNEALKYKEDGRAIGIEGVKVKNFEKYFPHKKENLLNSVFLPNSNFRVKNPKKPELVDIIKGRLLLCLKKDLEKIPLKTKFLDYADDIAVSSFLASGKRRHHLVTNVLNNKITNLSGMDGPMAQSSRSNWDELRSKALKEYYFKSH